MKKFLKRVLLLIVIIVLENNYSLCMAAEHKVESDINIYNTVYSSSQYAYSVGSIWKTPHHYDDNFRTNVYNAANKYSQISGISSYYNTEADYTYMRGNNPKGQRRIGSYIFFINGHANPISILSASSDTAKNRTGITVGYDSTVSEDGEFTVAGLQSTNMSGSRLILFVGCSTGAWPNTSENPYSTNLPIRAVERGANAALGFRKLISSRFGDGPNWLNAFNQAIVNGYTIDGANAYACTQYPNSDLSKCSMAEGDINSRVVPVTRYASMSEKKYENEYKSLVVPEQDIEIIIDEKNSDDEKALSKCENKYKEIIETIKTQDDDFNIDEYKVSSNCVNKENGVSYIYFTKYINDKIRTNKVYFIKTNRNVVNDITVAGIKNENIEKVNRLDETYIEDKIDKFNNQKTQILSNKLKCDNIKSIKLSEFSDNILKFDDNIKNIEEYYYYDYNTEELKYIMEYTENFELSTTDKAQIELDIEKI